jgi:hypothetical protein
VRGGEGVEVYAGCEKSEAGGLAGCPALTTALSAAAENRYPSLRVSLGGTHVAFRRPMRTLVLLLAVQVSTPMLAHNANRPAADGPVTFAELEGSIIEAKVVRQQVVQRDGHTFPTRFESNLKIVVGSADKFEVTWSSVSHTPRGVFHGKTLSRSMTLNQAKETNPNNLGGGHGVWMFDDGRLTNLRTYKVDGAFKRDISFTRTAGGFACTANEAFAREEGGGALVMNSAVDDAPVTIISWKQVSSTCHVSKLDRSPSAQSGDAK